MLEIESESDRENNQAGSSESEDPGSSDGDDVDLGNENHTVEVESVKSSKNVVSSNSSDCSQTVISSKSF